MSAALTFAVVLPALLVAHTVADHWVQTDGQVSTTRTTRPAATSTTSTCPSSADPSTPWKA